MYSTTNLKKMRKKKGLTICEISKRLKITSSYYWKIENKRRRLYYDMAIQIASILESKPDDLFYQKNKEL
ncbi:MAG: helix-turn-helix transcriptional regulator [Bacilli bacterium]|nr:helix-turn-helix transcriptional regulator [Bacilli bacterium]